MTIQSALRPGPRALGRAARLAALLGLALALTLIGRPSPAFAASISVTTTADGMDAAASCGAVTLASLPGPGGSTTLREAVCAANNNPGPDTITFAVNGTFALGGAANDDNGNSGDLDVNGSLTIQGNGVDNTIIDGGGIERIFDVYPGGPITFGLTALTVQNGDTRSTSFREGGAIYLESNVTATFLYVRVRNNFSGSNGAIVNRGSLSITDSELSGNQTIPDSGGTEGGAIRNSGPLTLTRVRVINNSVDGEGGGLATTVAPGVSVSIVDSEFAGNSATTSGGATGNGGAISTTGNQGTLNLTSVTLSGNSAQNNGGGLYLVAPSDFPAINLTNVTLAANVADSDDNGSGAGGGIYRDASGAPPTVLLRNTLVATNLNSTAATRDDVSGLLSNAGVNNLIGVNTGMSGLSNGVNGNQVGTGAAPINPLIGTLANNGGTTRTHALLTGSPAINAGTNTGCPATDQRGMPRSLTCDIGAHEFGDTTPPDVTVNQAPGQPDPTNASPINFRVVFSEPINVASFSPADVSLGGSAGATTVTLTQIAPNDGTTFNVAVTGMTGSGTVTAILAPGAVSDPAGNGNTASTSTDNSVAYDNVAPGVTVNQAPGQPDPANTGPITFRVVFSEPINVASFSPADVSINGTAGPTTVTLTQIAPNDGTTFSVAVSGMTSDGTLIASIASGVVSDPAGNGNASSTSTDNTVTYDATAPTVTINQSAAQADPANAGPIVFDVVFSESVTGFTIVDVIPGGTAGATTAVVSGSGANYTVSVSGMTGDGTVTASIAAGAATDAAGNANTASTSTDNTVTFDTSGTLVTINQAAAQVDPANAGPIVFDVVFSEPISVASFTGADVTLTGTAGATIAAVTEVAPNDSTTFEVAVSGMTGDGTVTASLAADVASDLSGNGNLASSSTDNTVTYDTTAPTVTINQAAAQADPANAGPIVFAVVFSEPVKGFADTDVTLSGTAGATTAAVTEVAPNDGTTFEVAISGMTSDGTVTAAIAAGAAADAAGNLSAASASADNSVTYDATGPSVTVEQAAAQADPAGSSPIVFEVVFGEPVVGFDNTDVALGGTAGATIAAVTEVAPNDGTTFEVAASGMTSAGTVTASVAAGAATDAAGNSSAASSSVDNTVTFDPAAPVATGIARADADPTNAASVGFIVTFSAAVTGVDQSDFALATSGGISGASVTGVSGSGSTRTVTVGTGAGSGTLRLDLTDDDSIVDGFSVALGGTGAGNGDFSGGQQYTIDRLAPQAGQLSVPAVVAGGADLTFTVVFSDNLGVSAASLATGAIQVSGPGGFTQAATLVSVSPSGDGTPRTATYRLTAPGGAWDSADNGDYSVGLAAGQVRDTVGNSASAAALGNFSVSLSDPPAQFRIYLPQVFRIGPLPWEFPYSRKQ
jgi:hypothetical protein